MAKDIDLPFELSLAFVDSDLIPKMTTSRKNRPNGNILLFGSLFHSISSHGETLILVEWRRNKQIKITN